MTQATSTLRLATRGSALAVAQSTWVAQKLEAAHRGLQVNLVTITTSGDRIHDRPLYEVGGKGLFTKEVEQALLRGEADLAVHSFKDVPVTMPLVAEAEAELVVGAVPVREDVRDVLIAQEVASLEALPEGATVGTTSPRRRALLLEARPDLNVVPMRGNIDTRLAKLGQKEVDAIVLAHAGLSRLKLMRDGYLPLDPETFIPAAGQGALAVQCRAADAATKGLLAAIEDDQTRQQVALERAVVAGLGGDCTSPIGVWARGSDERVELFAAYETGGKVRKTVATGPGGAAVAEVLAALGPG